MSTMTFEQMQALANQAAEQAPDMTEAQKGGSGARMLPAGYAYAQLVEFVEMGNHAQEFQGKAKDPAMEVQLGFALFNTADRQYANDDGTPYIVRPYSFSISRNEKARAFLLFKALNWKGTKKHFAQLLGEKYLVKIVHEAKSKTDATLVSRIDMKGFLPPLDAASQMPYPIPDCPVNLYRLFLWSHPTKEGWDALYVDGKYDDGHSKNFVQEKIMAALDFMGSPLQQLLFSTGIPSLPSTAPAAPVAAPVAPLPPGAGYAPMTPPASAPVAPAVAPVAPLAPTPPTAPVIAAVAPVQAPVAPVGPVIPTVPTPAVTPIAVPTFPSSPVLPQ